MHSESNAPLIRVPEVRALTGIRGVAAISVVFFHGKIYRVIGPVGHLWDRGYLAVDFFFCLSGFILALNYASSFRQGVHVKNFGLFFLRRIARIYPVYLLAIVLTVILRHQSPSWLKSMLPNVLLVQDWIGTGSIFTAAWSISAEWFAYLLFPLILYGTLFRSRWPAYGIAVASIVALSGLVFYGHSAVRAPLSIDYVGPPESLLRCVAEFSLGIFAYRTLGTKVWRRLKDKAWILPVITCTIIALSLVSGTDLAVALLFPILTMLLYGPPTLIQRILSSPSMEYLGQLSLSIYLLHQTFLAFTGDVIHQRMHRSAADSTLVGLACTFACSVFVYRFIEVPSRRLLRSRLEHLAFDHKAAANG